MTPEMIEVKSSVIAKIGYDGRDLYVEYKSGALYVYKEVHASIYENLQSCESKGRYMNEFIKKHYDYDYLR